MSFKVNSDESLRLRGLKKKEIKLRKDFKDNWGRFLDNHYDPQLHGKPFNAAMSVQKDSYKYSSAGLSHKFMRFTILQGADQELKPDRTKKLMRFKEQAELENGDVIVVIEY